MTTPRHVRPPWPPLSGLRMRTVVSGSRRWASGDDSPSCASPGSVAPAVERQGTTHPSGEDSAFPGRREEFTVLHAAKSLRPVGKEDVMGSGARVFERHLDSVGVVALRQSNVEANARCSDLTTPCSVSKSLIEQVHNRLWRALLPRVSANHLLGGSLVRRPYVVRVRVQGHRRVRVSRADRPTSARPHRPIA